jgi:hypothetical protein
MTKSIALYEMRNTPIPKLLLLLILLSISFAQDFSPKIKYNPKKYIAYRIDQPIIIDGKLNDSQWSNVEWTDDFVDIEGSLKPNPFFNTKVKMLWDSTYFYFGAQLEEPHVWATLTQRDAVIFKDNDFEIFLDPDGDTHNYYELEINALGTEWDLLLLKPYHDGNKVAIDSWDIAGLKSKVFIDGTINDPSDTDIGWSVEVAIPWQVLEEAAPNFHPEIGEQWKVNFSRVHWNRDIINGKYVKTKEREYNWVWSPQGHIYMHIPELWGLVQFEGIKDSSSPVIFKENNIDRVKWALRQVYYQQKNYNKKNGVYSKFLEELNLSTSPVENVPWPPKIHITYSGWEASLVWNGSTFYIRKDGLVWIQ